MTTSSTSTSQTSAPWSVQQPYLTQAFGQASTNLNNANANTYTGPQVAQMTPEQLANFRNMIGYGSNMSGANTSGSVGASTATAGSSALGAALQGLTGYSPTGGTQSNIDAATAYANNPAVDGMVTSAMRDATRQVSEQALPQLARSNAINGNTMSSRNAISQGLVERGLADKTADTSANIRGQLFDQGLQLAENGRQADNASRLSALTGAAGAGNSAVGTGVGAIGNGIDQAGNLFNLAGGGGQGLQTGNQEAIDNSKGMSEYANNTAAQNLQNFFNIIGSQNWGGTSQGTQTSTPSMWNTIGSALGIGSSLFKLSDYRLKTDIRRIGTADNGLGIYFFRYTDDPHRVPQIGYMAQEVEKMRPEAVMEFNGYKAVNYELASI
jgi:Chaperone of endosialidase